jgi:hypothetical protein
MLEKELETDRVIIKELLQSKKNKTRINKNKER